MTYTCIWLGTLNAKLFQVSCSVLVPAFYFGGIVDVVQTPNCSLLLGSILAGSQQRTDILDYLACLLYVDAI
ncbi:hypothetical protein V6Z12_D08G072500 [Gossypium hirsutum]